MRKGNKSGHIWVVSANNGPCLKNVGSFVNAHLSDAQTLANSLDNGVTPAEVLAVAGNEIGYGGRFARFGNFLGLHGVWACWDVLPISSTAYPMSYTYDLAENLASLGYPSGRLV